MEHARRVGARAQDTRVDEERRRFDLAITFENAPFPVDNEQVAGTHCGPVEPVRDDEELVALTGNPRGEVVRDALVQTESLGESVCSGEIDTGIE